MGTIVHVNKLQNNSVLAITRFGLIRIWHSAIKSAILEVEALQSESRNQAEGDHIATEDGHHRAQHAVLEIEALNKELRDGHFVAIQVCRGAKTTEVIAADTFKIQCKHRLHCSPDDTSSWSLHATLGQTAQPSRNHNCQPGQGSNNLLLKQRIPTSLSLRVTCDTLVGVIAQLTDNHPVQSPHNRVRPAQQ